MKSSVWCFLPVARAFKGLRPASAAPGAFVAAHFRFEIAVKLPRVLDFSAVFPETDGQAGEVSRAQCSRFKNSWTDDRHAQHVRLKLHEKVIGGSATIDAKFMENDAGVALHNIKHIGNLESDAFESGTGKVAGGRAASQAG